MARIRAWTTRPVFVSSTFRDFHAERDHLQRVVVPGLGARLRAARVPCHLTLIDLRWGVRTPDDADEEARHREVLKVCLKEIERSRPFLLILLGERYGWTPAIERAERAARDVQFRGSLEGKSITALEIE